MLWFAFRNDELASRYEKLTGAKFSFEKKTPAALLVEEDLTEEEEIARLLEAVHDEHELDYMGVAPSQTPKGLAMLKDSPQLSEEEEVRLLMEAAARENAEPPVSVVINFQGSQPTEETLVFPETNPRPASE